MVTLATLFVASVITTQGSTRTSYRLDLAPEPPENLRVEGLLAPTAIISETKPRFSFIHKLSPQQGFGVVQASYRITVRKSGADTLTWDSGDVASPMCSEIEYGGTRLAPFTVYVWTAEWTPSGGAASRSGTANSTFETGPMNPWDWKNAVSLDHFNHAAPFLSLHTSLVRAWRHHPVLLRGLSCMCNLTS